MNHLAEFLKTMNRMHFPPLLIYHIRGVMAGELSGAFVTNNDKRLRFHSVEGHFLVFLEEKTDIIVYIHEDNIDKYFKYFIEDEITKDMKDKQTIVRNVSLDIQTAREWYKTGGELKEIALQAFSENELKVINRPTSWEEYCNNYIGTTYYIDSGGSINRGYKDNDYEFNIAYDKNTLPSKELAEAFLAMMQLMSLRQSWVGDWKPNWTTNEDKFVIEYRKDEVYVEIRRNISSPLAFPTRIMAEDFLYYFSYLVKKAKVLV